MIDHMPIAWKLRRTPEVATGMVPAEYYALNFCAQSVIFICNILASLHLKVKPALIIQSDSKGAVEMIKTRRLTNHMKHLEAYFYFVKDKYFDGTIKPEWIPMKENFADIFTKPLGKVRFTELLE